MSFKILHFADPHVRDKDLQEIEKCFDTIIESAETEQPDVIVCAGDVPDSQNIKMDSPSAKLIFRVFNQLADFAPVVIVKGTPSHEGTAVEILNRINAKHQIWFSTRPEMLLLERGKIFDCNTRTFTPEYKPDALISMIPTPTKQFFRNDDSSIAKTDEEIAKEMNGIFAGFGEMASRFPEHFQVGGAFISETQQLIGKDIEISRAQIELANADVVCLGHIHMNQKIGKNIFYSGSIYRKDFGELEDKGFYIHEFVDFELLKTADSEFIKTPTRRLVKIEVDMTETDLTEIDDDLVKIFVDSLRNCRDPETGEQKTFVRIIFTVYQNDVEKIDKRAIMEWFAGHGIENVDIRTSIIPRENVRSENLLKLETLPDKLIEMENLKGETLDESIIEKAKILEADTQEDIVKQVRGIAS